jgi:hypothetical protein
MAGETLSPDFVPKCMTLMKKPSPSTQQPSSPSSMTNTGTAIKMTTKSPLTSLPLTMRPKNILTHKNDPTVLILSPLQPPSLPPINVYVKTRPTCCAPILTVAHTVDMNSATALPTQAAKQASMVSDGTDRGTSTSPNCYAQPRTMSHLNLTPPTNHDLHQLSINPSSQTTP